MQSVLSRNWTRITVSISCDDNHYTTGTNSIAVIMMLNKNTKVKVRSPDGNTGFFDIVAGVLQRDTLAPSLSTICPDYVLRRSIDQMKENREVLGDKYLLYKINAFSIIRLHFVDELSFWRLLPAFFAIEDVEILHWFKMVCKAHTIQTRVYEPFADDLERKTVPHCLFCADNEVEIHPACHKSNIKICKKN